MSSNKKVVVFPLSISALVMSIFILDIAVQAMWITNFTRVYSLQLKVQTTNNTVTEDVNELELLKA